MEKRAPILLFNDSAKKKILDSLGLKITDSVLIDDEGLIQTDQQYEKVSAEEFGGILIGSKVVIKKDSTDLVRYFMNQIN